MPELPEVETVRRTVLPHVLGKTIVCVHVHEPRLRQLVDTQALSRLLPGCCVVDVRRRAKYLQFDLSGGLVLLLHLGMSGRLGVMDKNQPLRKHDHVVLDLHNGLSLRFNDARRFGLVACYRKEEEGVHPRLRHLGVEPLDAAAFDAGHLHHATRGVHKPIKNMLMDAAVLVGVGNIYACEALFLAGIHPRRQACRLSLRRCGLLAAAVQKVLRDAIELGGTTLRDFTSVEGDIGMFANRLQVYGRRTEPCMQCGAAVRRIVQAGRSTFYCSICQR